MQGVWVADDPRRRPKSQFPQRSTPERFMGTGGRRAARADFLEAAYDPLRSLRIGKAVVQRGAKGPAVSQSRFSAGLYGLFTD